MHGKKSPILEARRSSLAEEMNIGNENSWEEKIIAIDRLVKSTE
jgi:hypothetical protein